MQVHTVEDRRAPGLPDIPYSAYCRVCWRSIYVLWIDSEDHGGRCMHGCAKSTDCPEARARDHDGAMLAKDLAAAGPQVKGTSE